MTFWRREWDAVVCNIVKIWQHIYKLPVLESMFKYNVDEKEDFESYVERLEAWLVVNGVTVEQKSSVFLAVIGATTYKLLKSLLAPEKPNQNIRRVGQCSPAAL